MVKYIVNVTLTPTMIGFCKTFNILKAKDFFNDKSVSSIWAKRSKGQITNPLSKMKNLSQYSKKPIPLTTASKQLGLEIIISFWANHTGSFPIMIHSPHELPNENSQKFVLSYGDVVDFLITPQLKQIDDSLIGMKPEEFRVTRQ